MTWFDIPYQPTPEPASSSLWVPIVVTAVIAVVVVVLVVVLIRRNRRV